MFFHRNISKKHAHLYRGGISAQQNQREHITINTKVITGLVITYCDLNSIHYIFPPPSLEYVKWPGGLEILFADNS